MVAIEFLNGTRLAPTSSFVHIKDFIFTTNTGTITSANGLFSTSGGLDVIGNTYLRSLATSGSNNYLTVDSNGKINLSAGGTGTGTTDLTAYAGAANINTTDSDPITTIGNSTNGLSVNGGLTVSSNGANITGDTSISGNLTGLTGLTLSSGNISTPGNITSSGSINASNGLISTSGGANITGNTYISGDTSINGILNKFRFQQIMFILTQ